MHEQVYYAYCANSSPMLCIRAHYNRGSAGAHINTEISSTLFASLKRPNGAQLLNYIAEHCVKTLSGPLIESSGTMTIDIPLGGHNLVRARLVRNGDFSGQKFRRLGELFVLATQQALFDGTSPVVKEAGFRTSLEWLYTAWTFEQEGRSYFLTQIHVPEEVTAKRLVAFAEQLRRFAHGKVSASRGLPTEFHLHEETPSNPIRVSGAAGNFDVAAADARIVELFASAQRQLG